MASHQIISHISGRCVTYIHAHLSASHHTDGLSRLCRLMVAAGKSGVAEVRGTDGKLRLLVPSLEKAARLSLTENDRGFRLAHHRPFADGTVRMGILGAGHHPSAVPSEAPAHL